MEGVSRDVERGRERYAARAWGDAYASLARADHAAALDPADVELFATSAYMVGRETETLELLERAHHGHVAAGDWPAAVGCAVWLSLLLGLRGETGPAAGWLGRARRLLERHPGDCVERGYLLIPVALGRQASGDLDGAFAAAVEAAEIGARFADPDLLALAVDAQGCVRVEGGRVQEGLELLDEAMVAVTAGELSPVVTGLVYCSVILACGQLYELRRAHEWTAALSRWCEGQPDLVAFTGRCLIHRAEVLQAQGAWSEALEEVERAASREGLTSAGKAQALYRQGELHRLRGELQAAEAAFREASSLGFEPQPGLALLRLAEGRRDVAATTIRRALLEAAEPLERARLLPAYVEIMLAAGEREASHAACGELEEIALAFESKALAALAAYAGGAVELAGGNPGSALAPLRRAHEAWQKLEAPYEAARARVLLGEACRAVGDEEAAVLELDAARASFEKLGAKPDAERALALLQHGRVEEPFGLTGRELEVLRLVAAGNTNRQIAAALVISEHTVARHVQNIFAKLGVGSRTAASALAFEHGLV